MRIYAKTKGKINNSIIFQYCAHCSVNKYLTTIKFDLNVLFFILNSFI